MTTIAQLLAAPLASFHAEDDVEQASAYCYERGWTDGLPVIAPTVERVERMLGYCHRPLEAAALDKLAQETDFVLSAMAD